MRGALRQRPPASGKAKGPPGLVGVDHAGITVPDIDEAIAWFEDVMGCSAPLTFGPFSDPTGTFMQDLLGVHPRAVIEQITMIRCGRSANIELFEYDAPDQRRTFPKNSDWAGHHIAFYVTDIDAAVAYMQSKGVEKLLGPLRGDRRPCRRAVDQLLPRAVRHLHRADQLPERDGLRGRPGQAALVAEAERPRSVETSVPGLLGMDHVGITVPDIDEAIAWFEDVMGCSAPLTFGPFSDPTGTFMQDLLGVHPRAVIEQITMVRCGDGPNIELFQYTSPDQDRSFRKNSDFGGKHIAFYVRRIDKAVAYMQSKGVEKLLGPLAVTDGPAAGQSINYFRAPFGTYIELISYPKGMAYEETAETLLWDPRDNRH